MTPSAIECDTLTIIGLIIVAAYLGTRAVQRVGISQEVIRDALDMARSYDCIAESQIMISGGVET